LPLRSFEDLRNPVAVPMMEVSVPTYADPIQLKALDVKLTSNIFEVAGRSDICFVI
jgi:hypothetical protein